MANNEEMSELNNTIDKLNDKIGELITALLNPQSSKFKSSSTLPDKTSYYTKGFSRNTIMADAMKSAIEFKKIEQLRTMEIERATKDRIANIAKIEKEGSREAIKKEKDRIRVLDRAHG